jgi:hypothetical protein
MMAHDEALWSASGGTEEQDEASLADIFKNRYSNAMYDGHLSANILQSSWDDFFNTRDSKSERE